MKKRLLFITLFISVLLLVVGCAQTRMADYQPKSAEEKEVFDFMAELNEAFQARDLTKVMACYHDDAKIRIVNPTSVSHPVVSKQYFEKWLEGGGFKVMSMDIMKEVMNPEITIVGDKATVKGGTSSGHFHNRFVWDLVKDNEKWCIIKDDWWWR